MNLGALLLLTSSLSTTPSIGPTILVSWDGAGYETISRLLQQGRLPHLQQIMRRGAYAAGGMEPPFPSKTAVSHVAMFTGATPGHSGVTGNTSPVLPRSEHTVLEGQRGFDRRVNTGAEPVWLTVAKASKSVMALSAAGSYPPDQDVANLKISGSKGRYSEFSGFETRVADPKMWHFTLPEANSSTDFQVGDSEFKATRVRSRLELRLAGNLVASLTRSNGWSAPIKVVKGKISGNTAFRLFGLDLNSGKCELYQGEASLMTSTESPSTTEAYMAAYGVFHDDPWRLYSRGEFGKLSILGGDGTAEQNVLDVVRHDVEALKRSFRWGLKHQKADLVFHYEPFTDSAGHTLMGVLDPHLTHQRSASIKGEQALYDGAFQLADEWLGDMMAAAGPSATFIVVSDHGMAGADKIVNVNRVLEDAGLLVKDASGQIDLSKTKVVAAPWTEYSLAVNSVDWKGGIVPLDQINTTLQQAEKALQAVRYEGSPVFNRFWMGEQRTRWGVSGTGSPDLKYDLVRGFEPSDALSTKVIEPATGPLFLGRHGFAPDRSEMHSIFFAAGPGIATGTKIKNMKSIDVTPTLLNLMGIRSQLHHDGHAVLPIRTAHRSKQ